MIRNPTRYLLESAGSGQISMATAGKQLIPQAAPSSASLKMKQSWCSRSAC